MSVNEKITPTHTGVIENDKLKNPQLCVCIASGELVHPTGRPTHSTRCHALYQQVHSLSGGPASFACRRSYPHVDGKMFKTYRHVGVKNTTHTHPRRKRPFCLFSFYVFGSTGRNVCRTEQTFATTQNDRIVPARRPSPHTNSKS